MKLQTLTNNLKQIIIGNDDKIDLALSAILAGGSILLEDRPGTGKTTFAKAIASRGS